jgi:HD-GYP domain-containing protein (c-di-GMP phosphodiesterase class II)
VSLRISEILAALSHALDLTEGQPVGHAERTCLISLRVAAGLGLSAADRHALVMASLLKDVGCSSSAARMCRLFGTDDITLKANGKLVDWQRPADVVRYTARHVEGGSRLARARRTIAVLRELSDAGSEIVEARCDRGASIVRALGCPDAAADAVYQLDEHWNGKGNPRRLTGDEIAPLARIVALAQSVDVFTAVRGRAAAREMVRERSGRWYEPAVATAFLQIADDDPLWDDLQRDGLAELVRDLDPPELDAVADEAALDRVCEAFADVIDAKSPFTARHSRGVAAYGVLVGETLGLGGDELRDLRRAGLLHDIGKLGVPNSILDKPAKLTDEEFATMRLHPRFTEEILRGVAAFAPFAAIAAAHHERMDGRGYHRGVRAGDLPAAARALAVADVFEALTADRPYRAPLDPETALSMMRRDAGTHLCATTLAALEDGLATAVRRAA